MALDPAIWSFAAGGEITEHLEWLTDVMEPPASIAQTRPLRTAPRTLIEWDGLEDGAQKRRLDHALAHRGAHPWWIPLHTDAVVLSGLSAGASAISANFSHRRFASDAKAVVLSADRVKSELVDVTSVGVNGITLAEPLQQGFGPGCLLAPAMQARMIQAPEFGIFGPDAMYYRAQWRLDAALDFSAVWPIGTYRGLPVLELEQVGVMPDADPMISPVRRIDEIDSTISAPFVVDRAGVPLPIIRLSVCAVGRSNGWMLRGFLHALQGRNHPIWVPQMHAAFSVVAESGVMLTVEATGMSADGTPMPNWRDLRIETRTGGTHYRRIVSVLSGPGIDKERLQLDTALPAAHGGIVSVEFMALCRQDADVNALRYFADDVVMTELVFRAEAARDV